MNLVIATVDDADPVIVTLSGELDLASAPQLEERIRELIAAGRVELVIDLAGLSFCDSTGIGTFVRAKNGCLERGGYVRLASPGGTVARVLEVVGLLTMFPTYQTVDAARRADANGLMVAGA